MRTVTLGPVPDVSRLTLGGGGLGQLWGETTTEEATATVRAAVEAGITLIDTAPMYRHCEAVIGEAFAGKPPAHVRFTTKCQLGTPPAGTVAERLEASLDASLAAMRLDYADIFFLHSNIREGGYAYARYDHRRDRFSTTWSLYETEVVPAFEDLRARGRIRAWGITGVGIPETIIRALNHTRKPAVVQAVANLLDSPGDMRNYDEPARPRDIIAAAVAAGVGVMGIRAVQAGALCAVVDRELPASGFDAWDYVRAAPYRALCAELGVDPAVLAHRYALDIAGVDTVILGVKNRAELAQCVEAEAMGPLGAEALAKIEALGLRLGGGRS
jgi:aryl-alcohol dehydrogenase-like predicted oxidoreductase